MDTGSLCPGHRFGLGAPRLVVPVMKYTSGPWAHPPRKSWQRDLADSLTTLATILSVVAAFVAVLIVAAKHAGVL